MPYGLVFHALAPFVADDVLLVGQRRLVDLLEQVSHAVRLEPERELELIRRNGLVVVGAIVIGRPVQVARAGGLEHAKVRVRRHVLRALEHHVLEQVCKPGPARLLVGRADVIPEIDADHREPTILAEDHFEPVRQLVFLDRHAGNVIRCGGAVGLIR